eukprot:364789-Chlamydomonas_euryale.AAC.17
MFGRVGIKITAKTYAAGGRRLALARLVSADHSSLRAKPAANLQTNHTLACRLGASLSGMERNRAQRSLALCSIVKPNSSTSQVFLRVRGHGKVGRASPTHMLMYAARTAQAWSAVERSLRLAAVTAEAAP